MKQMRKMNRLSSSSSPRKIKPAKKKKPTNWDVLDWDNIDPIPDWLLDRERDSAEDLLPKGGNRSSMTRALNGMRYRPY